MTKAYFELRKQAARGTDSLVADMMRHLYTRQHLGKALVVCEHPAVVLSAARKQWLKLARTLQKQRASTLNAEKLLKYTYSISRMQHMRFTSKPSLEDPEAEVYFLSKQIVDDVPIQCMSVYLSAAYSLPEAETLTQQLPTNSLIIDYNHRQVWLDLSLEPKRVLEETVSDQWQQMEQFLRAYDIHAPQLVSSGMHNIEAMDDALDTLLGGIGPRFLQIASEFQRSIELARPLKLSKTVREHYDVIILLAHRVQALSSTSFKHQFLQTYNEDDTYFLYDRGRGRVPASGKTLAETVARHKAAGRHQLARALASTGYLMRERTLKINS